MAPPSDADGGAPLRGRLAVDVVATTDAAGRPAHHPVARAAAVPEQRRRWMDILRLVLRYVGNGIGQVLRLTVRKNLGEPRDAGVVVADKLQQARDGADLVVDDLHNEKGPDAIKKSREERHGASVDDVNRDMAKKRKRQRRIKRGNADTNMNIDTRTAAKKNQAWLYQNRRPRASPFVMVGNYRVYKEQKDLYALYCQEKPSSSRLQLCHMCISQQIYFSNKFRPDAMLKHCCEKHTAGIECTEPGCRVRVPTEEERSLHISFCHRLPAGWWDWEEYRELDR